MGMTEVAWPEIVIGVIVGIVSFLLTRAIKSNDKAIESIKLEMLAKSREHKAEFDKNKKEVDNTIRELEDKVERHHDESKDRLYNNHLEMLNKLNDVSLKLEKFNIK